MSNNPRNMKGIETIDIVCKGLSMLGGVSYQRQGSIFSGVCQASLNRALHKFTRAAVTVMKDEYIHLPSTQMLRKNDQYIREKYNLAGFGYGVDGVFFPFEKKPRNLPEN